VVWTIAAEWEERMWLAARAELPHECLEMRSLAAAIVERSHRYTDARESLHAPLGGRERARDLAARALFFSIADAVKVQVPLVELRLRGLLPRAARVLDIGAGPGAMTIGLLADASVVPAQVTAIDLDEGALRILERVVAAVPHPRPDLRTVVADVGKIPDGQFDLALAGSVLNELDSGRRLDLVADVLSRITDEGAFIIVEPALRETARALHELRDAILAAGIGHVFAPCTRSGPCPALTDRRDWCHEDRPFQPPSRLAGLMTRTGLRGPGLKFAYLTLRRRPDPLVSDDGHRRALRIVSDALDAKGTIERIGCGAEGRHRIRVLKRNRGVENAAVAEARRGDVLLVDEQGRYERRDPSQDRKSSHST
jgi:SAM-dependent methyltransferase